MATEQRTRRRSRPEPGHRSQFDGVIEKLDGLTPLQQEFLRARWLSQVRYLGDKAEFSKRWHYALRLTAIVGGVTIPALIGLNVAGTVSQGVRWTVFGLGLLVALATAVDEFFHFGEQWRHYRRTAELLKSVGWEFIERSGPFAEGKNHAAVFAAFALQIENVMERDVEAFFTRVVREQKPPSAPRPSEDGSDQPDPSDGKG
jgi:hypothetical protein